MSSRTPIRGIIFDAFDTLVKPKSPPWKQYAEEARRVGFEFEDQDLKEAFKYAFKQTSSCHPLYGLRSSPPLRSPDEFWSKLIATTFSRPSLRIPNPDLEKSLPILTSRLVQRFGSREAYELFPEVETSLEELKSISFETRSKSSTCKIETLRLSLATNSDSRMLDVLKDFNLNRFLNLDIPNSSSALPPAAISLPTISRAIEEHEAKYKKSGQDQLSICSPGGEGGAATLSYFEGFEKPHPDFFKIASQRLFPELQNLDLQSVVYVGDQLKEDYLGAKQAGLRAFWLRRKGEDERSQPEIDVKGLNENVDLEELENDTVGSLTEVVDRVREINASL